MFGDGNFTKILQNSNFELKIAIAQIILKILKIFCKQPYFDRKGIYNKKKLGYGQSRWGDFWAATTFEGLMRG